MLRRVLVAAPWKGVKSDVPSGLRSRPVFRFNGEQLTLEIQSHTEQPLDERKSRIETEKRA